MARYSAARRRSIASILAPLLIVPGLLWNVVFDPASPAANAAACAAGVVTPLHGPRAYFDTKTTPDADAIYLGYKVTPVSTVAALSVEVAVSNNDAVSLNANQPSTQNHGTVTAGSSINSYFLADVRTQPNSNVATITVTVRDGASTVCTFSDSVKSQSRSALKANANKIYSAAITGQGQTVGKGSQIVVTVTGNTGTIGSGPDATREINLSPVSEKTSFDASAWQLTDVEFHSDKTTCGTSGDIFNRLFISNQTTPSSANCSGLYSANYVFVARSSFNGANASSTVQAFSYIASGNLIKHTAPFTGNLSLPTLEEKNTNVLTGTKPNLATTLASAPITFTANDATMVTAVNVDVTSSALTFVGETNGIDWSQFCIVNPSTNACGTAPITVKTNGGAGSATAGVFSIVTMADGTKRLLFNPETTYVTGSTDDPAQVEFKLVDGSGVTSFAFAQATVTADFIANPVDFVALGTLQTESPAITAQNGSIDATGTCLWNGAGCISLPYLVTNIGTWNLSSDKTKVVFQAASGFSGQTSVDFKIVKSGAVTTASGTATVNVVLPPSVTAESASTSAGVEVTLSPTISAEGNVTKCLYSSEPASDPCTSTISSSANVTWTLRNDGVVSFSSVAGFSGVSTIYFGVRDTRGQFASSSMTVEVLPPAAPSIAPSAGATTTSHPVRLNPTTTASTSTRVLTVCQIDDSGCGSSVSIAGQGTFTVVGSEIEFVSLNSFTGSAVATAKITDDVNQSSTASVTVTVTEPVSPSVGGGLGTTSPTTAVFIDPNISSPLPIAWCFIDPSDSTRCLDPFANSIGTWTTGSNQVKFTSVAGYTGSSTISLKITDTLGRSATGSIQVDVVSSFVAQSVAVTTKAASGVGETSATLNGEVFTGNSTGNITFCFGTSSDLTGCESVSATPATLGSNGTANPTAVLSGLLAGSTYYFRVTLTDVSGATNGATLSFQTSVAVQAPTSSGGNVSNGSDPVLEPISCSPATIATPLSQPAPEGVGFFQESIFNLFTGPANTFGQILIWATNNAFGDALFSSQTMTANPLVGKAQSDGIETSRVIGALFAGKKPADLAPSDITIQAGTEPNTVEITSADGTPLSIDGAVQSVDLDLYTQYSGAELNNPVVWQQQGYGSLCWKLEPFDDTSFVLPDPIEFPGATPDGEWVYSNVIVKAGSVTADFTTFQTNTLFPSPSKGSMVWADVNGNGIYDPGGRTGDKAISHIVICIKRVDSSTPNPTQSAQGTTSPPISATPTPTPTPSSSATPTPTPTPTPSSSATPTPSPTPSSSATPTTTACPSPSPSVTPKIAPPSPAPTQSAIVIRLLSVPTTSSPTSSPAPSPTSSPSPTEGPTDPVSPSPSPSSAPSPSPTEGPTDPVSPSPSPSSAPNPSATPFSAIDLNPPISCQANATFGVALKVTNGLSTLCFRVTSAYFSQLATGPRFELTGIPITEDDASTESNGELAETGFESGWLGIVSMLLIGMGLTTLGLSRRRN